MADSIALPQTAAEKPWWREVTWYHWLVLLLAAGGWLFDCMGQRIFVLRASPLCGNCWEQPPRTVP